MEIKIVNKNNKLDLVYEEKIDGKTSFSATTIPDDISIKLQKMIDQLQKHARDYYNFKKNK